MRQRSDRLGLLSTVLVLLVALQASGPLMAQNFGRLVLTVKDEQGKPVQGVVVTATCDELPKFKAQKKTNKRGEATLAFSDATRIYDIQVEYGDYPPIEMPFKPEIRQTLKQEVKLSTTAGRDAPEDAAEVRYTPAERIFNEGVEAARAGDLETARARWSEALAKDPDMALAHSAMGGLQVETGEYEAAVMSAKRLLELEPDNPRGYRILYDAHTALGENDLAGKALAAMAAADESGDAATLVYNEGVAALKVGDSDTAKRRFREALDVDPELTVALSALAVTLMNEGSFAEAAETGERLLLLEPDNLKAKGLTYDAYRALGDVEKESAAFDRLAAGNPALIGKTMLDRGVQLFEEGAMAGAVSSLEKALAADPSLAKAHYYLGLCFVNLGRKADAREQLAKFVELEPGDPEAEAAAAMVESLSGAD